MCYSVCVYLHNIAGKRVQFPVIAFFIQSKSTWQKSRDYLELHAVLARTSKSELECSDMTWTWLRLDSD